MNLQASTLPSVSKVVKIVGQARIKENIIQK